MSTSTHAPHEFIDFRKFEELYSLSRRTFFAWIADGRLAAYRPSKRKTFVRRSDVEKLFEASKAVNNLDMIVDDVMSELTDAR